MDKDIGHWTTGPLDTGHWTLGIVHWALGIGIGIGGFPPPPPAEGQATDPRILDTVPLSERTFLPIVTKRHPTSYRR